MSSGIASTASLMGPSLAAGSTPNKIKQAAQQFESLLLAQMMKSGRESASNLGGEDEDSESSTMFDVSDQQFAQLLAKNGGIGLTKLVTAGLERAPGKH